MGAIGVLDKGVVAVTPGGQASTTIRVRNTGTLVDELTLEVVGDAASWASAEPPTVSLLPDAEQVVTIRFHPPRSYAIPAGVMPFAVRVTSKEDPEGSVAEEGTLDVAPYAEATAELVPRTSRGRRSARHDLALDNRGNAPLNATVEGTDADQKLAFEIDPPSVVAQPGTASFSTVRVRPRATFWRGPSRTHQFRVLVTGPDASTITADGSLLQDPLIPPWLPRAIAGLIALLIALLVLWLVLLRPSLEGMVTDSVNDQLAAAGITPKPGGGGGGGGGGGASPSPTPKVTAPPTQAPPTATPAPPTPTPPPAPTPVPLDGRLTIDGGPVAVGASAGKTLYVTDLVFSNGQPDLTLDGVLQLLRGNDVLMELRLADFRDLDYHFVTPITVPTGQKLRIDCQTPSCQGAALYFSGYER